MKNIIRIVIIVLITLIINFYFTTFLSGSFTSNEIDHLSQPVNLFIFQSYMYGIYFAILLLISTIIVCTILIIEHFKKIEASLAKNRCNIRLKEYLNTNKFTQNLQSYK